MSQELACFPMSFLPLGLRFDDCPEARAAVSHLERKSQGITDHSLLMPQVGNEDEFLFGKTFLLPNHVDDKNNSYPTLER